jgi:hypothetical protein
MGYFVPKLLEETVGAKFTVVAGYPGGSEVDLAVERNEVQCRSLSAEAFFSREPFFTWRKNNLFECWCTGLRTAMKNCRMYRASISSWTSTKRLNPGGD